MLSRIVIAAFALTAPILTACSDQVDDELDRADGSVGDASKADAAGGTYTYYFIKADLRSCAAPGCGGVFYRLANAETTVCLDGSSAEECYAASEDKSRLGLGEVGMAKVNEAPQLLVRATIAQKNWGIGLGTF